MYIEVLFNLEVYILTTVITVINSQRRVGCGESQLAVRITLSPRCTPGDIPSKFLSLSSSLGGGNFLILGPVCTIALIGNKKGGWSPQKSLTS